MAATAVLLFAVAQSYPLIGMELRGLSQSARIESGVVGLIDRGFSPLAVLVLLVSFAAPLLRIAANTYVLASISVGRRPRHLATIFRLSERLRPWAMLDVFLLGTLIAVTKLHDLAAVDIGMGLWTLGLLVLTLAALDSSLAPDLARTCARCGARLSRRKPDSLTRTWALVLTGLLLYIPANAYPAMTVISFGRGAPSTIIGGVVALMNGEDWPLALLIFTASVAIPVLKLLGLAGLLLSVQCGLRSYLMDRTRLYRIIEFIGRWSMIDVFVAALLTALVTLGQVATIEPGLGILAFGGVVVMTMMAAETFDPRLMWDAAKVSDA